MLLALEALLVVKLLLAIWVIRELRSAPGSESAAGVYRDGGDGDSGIAPAGAGSPEIRRVPPDS